MAILNSAPFSLNDIQNITETTTSLVDKYIVSPIANLGIAGFVFDIMLETKIELTADITDHYVENNTAIQDQIAIKPERITLRGYVGELVNTVAAPKSTTTKLAEKLVTIAAFLPLVTDATKQLQSAIVTSNTTTSDYLGVAFDAGVDFYSIYKKLNPPKTKQAAAFNFFRALYASRQLVGLETPYSFFNNMAIESITAIQPEESESFSDFTVTLKKIRIANTDLVTFDPSKYQGREVAQKSEVQNKGIAIGKKPKKSKRQSLSLKGYNAFTQ